MNFLREAKGFMDNTLRDVQGAYNLVKIAISCVKDESMSDAEKLSVVADTLSEAESLLEKYSG